MIPQCPIVPKRHNYYIAMTFAITTVLLTWLAVGIWMASYLNLTSPVIVWVDGGFVNKTAHAGDIVEVLRVLDVKESVSVTISRALIRGKGEDKEVYNLPVFFMVYEKGIYRQLRKWQIPHDLPNGDWNLHNQACYWNFGIIQKCIDLPLLPITIVEKR